MKTPVKKPLRKVARPTLKNTRNSIPIIATKPYSSALESILATSSWISSLYNSSRDSKYPERLSIRLSSRSSLKILSLRFSIFQRSNIGKLVFSRKREATPGLLILKAKQYFRCQHLPRPIAVLFFHQHIFRAAEIDPGSRRRAGRTVKSLFENIDGIKGKIRGNGKMRQ